MGEEGVGLNPTTQAMGACPCEREIGRGGKCVIGTKLTNFGHLVGCTCRPCQGRRNKRKGRASEAKTYKALGGQGQTLKDDLMFTMSLDIAYENKAGDQIPASFTKFITSEWAKDALRQAEKKIPVGADARRALVLDCGPRGRWAVVEIRGK